MSKLAHPGAAAPGLEDVVAAETRLSHIDAHNGRLTLVGHSLEALAEQHDFESVSFLLLQGRLPNESERREWHDRLGSARVSAHRTSHGADTGGPPMASLRARIAALPESADREPLELAAELLAVTADWTVRVAAGRAGRRVPAPDPALPHAADVLRMSGLVSGSRASTALDRYLTAVADHGMNASTFATRVVASTGSDLVSAVTAGVGALKGPLHGGAPGPVLDMLEAIGEPERSREFLEAELDAGRRLMGFGHRVYRVRDPRARVLERAIRALCGDQPELASRLALARAVEEQGERLLEQRHPERALRANVEFYTAVLLDALGFSRDLFTLVFACSRMAGWCAHYFEQRNTGRLLRPRARYIGPIPAAPPSP